MESKHIWIAIGIFIIFYLVFKDDSSNSYPKKPEYRAYPQYSYPNTFRGYSCIGDCSGHIAGYQWAEENDIDDPDDCVGNSDSFIEGCLAYVEENY